MHEHTNTNTEITMCPEWYTENTQNMVVQAQLAIISLSRHDRGTTTVPTTNIYIGTTTTTAPPWSSSWYFIMVCHGHRHGVSGSSVVASAIVWARVMAIIVASAIVWASVDSWPSSWCHGHRHGPFFWPSFVASAIVWPSLSIVLRCCLPRRYHHSDHRRVAS
jgi:hypothetical protein